MRFQKSSELRCTPEELFAFHQSPEALEQLTPPWSGVRVLTPPTSLEVGTQVVVSVPLLGPLRKKWVARHTAYEPPRRFVDEQVSGPFRSWVHEHLVEPCPGGARLTDTIDYELPGGPLARVADWLMVRRTLEKTFAYRHAVTRRALEGA